MHRKICILITVMAFVILSAGCAFGVAIDAANFPDASFRSHVKQYDTGWTEYDSNGDAHWVGHDDGFLDWPEIERVTGMNAFRHSSVKGIENFTMLDTLGVNGNDNYADGPGETFLTEVDVSALSRLGLFNCFHNRINALDVSHNPELWSLLCFDNNIQHLDVSHNPKLRILMCDQNPLGQLNVSNNTQLENLRCYRNELKTLNVRNNPALSVLYCFDNQISELDLSNNPEMEELQCHNNPLGELDVSHNLKLKYLFCGSDDLRELDVTNNQSLMTLHCWSNHLTELDLSKNTALTEVLLGVQEANGLKVKAVPEGYEVCLNDYVSDVNNIDIFRVGANDYSMRFTKYSNENGKATVIFPEPPKTLHYFYDTRSPNNDQLYVVIKRSLNVDVIERGKGKDLIIGGMNDNCYLDVNGNAVTESSIADLSARVYGKKGFVADGNSRLIVRVKTQRPGNVTFEVKDNIGVHVERLSDRADFSLASYLTPNVSTTQTSEGNYQASIVLVAPEMYPSGKHFPSDKFAVHVKFTADETGEEIPEEEKEMEEDIELEIHAAPVVLIHSLGSKITVESSFASGGNGYGTGILPVLRAEGFNVYSFNYDGTQGISSSNILAPYFGDLFCKVFWVFEDYLKKGIVCTKADMIGHGFGGLIARHFCMPSQRLPDGNYFTQRSYGRGMVRRMITVSTPHIGTLWGNAMTDDWRLIKENAALGSLNAAYVAMRYLRVNFAYWLFGAKSTGYDMLFVNSSAWDDVSVGSIYTNSGFPSDVPMYSIYGKIKHFVDTIHLLKSSLSLGLGKLVDAYGKLPVLAKLTDRFSVFKTIFSEPIKAFTIGNPVKAAKLNRIENIFAEIKEALVEPRILEWLKLIVKRSEKADFETLLKNFRKADKILADIKAQRIKDVTDKYKDLKVDISAFAEDLRPYVEAAQESYGKISSYTDPVQFLNEGLSVSTRRDNILGIPSWVTGAAEIASVVLSTPVALVDLFFEMPFAVMTLMFGEDDYDMFTSETSAAWNLSGASLGLEGWDYRYDNICKQDYVGYEAVKVLRSYSRDKLKIFGTSRTGLPAEKALTANTKDSVEEEDDYDITIEPEKLFEKRFNLTAAPEVLSVSDTGYITLKAEADTDITESVYAVLRKDGTDSIIPMFSTEDRTFEIIIQIDSTDAGTMLAYCFSQSSEGSLYKSDMAVITAKPDISADKLSFPGSNGIIFTDSSSDIPAGLIAQTSDGFAFDVSSPLMGTSWTSSNPSAAYVSSDGMIHSLADGTATLTASYAGLTASIIVNVGNNFSAPEITSQSLDAGNIGKNYTAQLQASGTPLISWRIIDGRLPFDLTLSDSGTISGYPSEEGTFTFTAEASNIFGTDSKDFTITVGNAAGAAVTIDANNFPDDSFRAFISDNLDWNHDGLLTEQEISSVTAIDVSNMGIKSLKGIEFFTALEYLTCNNNELAELDLSKNENIYGVASQNNKLESINLANCLKLFQIWLDNNKLSSLDFADCPALSILSCKNNLITTLDLRRQANITDLQCDEGVEILYSDTPGGSEILIDANNFPDDAFRKFIADNFDWDKSSSLSDSEIAAITGIEAVNMGIKTLKGIEHFTALEYLTCVDNDLEEIDLSGNPNFIGLAANNNKLKRVNVSNNPKLYQIWVNNNKLTALDFSHNPELAIIDCSKNFLTELDISENANLRELYFVNYPDEGSEDVDYHTLQGNAIRNIDLSGAPLLTHIACSANGIETLDLSNNPLLESIECHYNYLTQIDTSIFTELKYLHVGGNKLSTLDVSQNTKLQELFCGDNLLETLTLGDKPDMFRLHCWGNNLQSLNLTEAPALQELHFSSNKISAADLTNCKELVSLDCGNNLLAELDISQNTKLKRIACDNNSIGTTDFTQCPELVQIFFSYNKAERADLTKNPKLKTAYFLNNMLTEIDFSGNPELEEIGLHENRLTRLDVSQLAKLRELHCGDNLLETLTLGDKPGLLKLYCYRNNLTALNLSGCPALKELSFGANKISAVDITHCKELESLAFWDNLVTELDISEHVKLKDCIFGNNRVKTLNVGNKPELLRLHCYSNDLSAIDVTGCPALADFSCEGNKISFLDVTKCKVLEKLYCRDNLIKVLDLSECPKITTLTVDEGVKLIYTHEETPPEILMENLTNAATNQPYSLQLTASGANPLTWTHTGKLPAGLSLSASGLISGTPTKAGKSSFTVTAENSYGKTSRAFTIQTFDPVTITTASLKAGTITKSYSVTMRAKGTKAITWSAEGLPDGLTINEKGKISGKPTVYGVFDVKLKAENGAGITEKTLQLEIKAIPPTLSGTLAKPTLNVPYSSGLRLSKGSTPVTWSVEGNLPGGLSLDPNTGIISGTPTSYDKSGFKIIITATNYGGSKSKKITLKVNGKAPKITSKLPGATAGQYYSAELTATGSEPITFNAELPEYLTLDGSTISGTVPDSVRSFKIKAYASNPVKKNVKKSYTIRVSAKKSLPQNQNADNGTDITEVSKGVHSEVIVNVPDPTENIVHLYSESYVIVAELGEVSADKDGMHDFDVEIPDSIPEGLELVYISNSDEPSEDDDIAEFFDEEGNEITKVPESRKISVSVWLNPERIYMPVIAVKH